MSRKQKVFRPIFVVFGVIALSFFVGKYAGAIGVGSISSGAVNGAAGALESRYHLNLQSLQDQGENLNVSSQKGQAPQVRLYFSPSDPKPGIDMEARAFPEFFGNEKDTLYYTWYIKRKGCEVDYSPGEVKRKLCDRNDDKKITVEDWKIEAMQTIAARNFDSTCSLNDSLSDDERKTCAANMYAPGAPSRINPSGKKCSGGSSNCDSDKDGYRATFGGDGRSMFADDSTPAASLPGETTECSDSSFTPSATAGTHLYMAKTIGSETTSNPFSSSETLYEVATGFSETTSEFCYEICGVGQYSEHGTGWCTGNDHWNSATNYISDKDSMNYFGGGKWIRAVSPVTTLFPAGRTYHLYWRDNTPALASERLVVSDNSTSSGVNTNSGHGVCYIHDFKDGYNYELSSCKHLFPKSYEITGSGTVSQVGETGASDDSFPIKQEHFWRTDPEDPSTAQNGNKDEANLAGLARDTFRWTYAPEDMVGVAVEGTSMYNTKYNNSSMMIMWALPRNKCEVKGKSSRTENVKGYGVIIKTSNTDIDACLEDNLVDPTEGGQAENVEISLSYTPEAPSAKLIPRDEDDASVKVKAETGDTLVVNAATSNVGQGTPLINYTWRVQASKDGTFNTRFGDENIWVDITKDLQAAKNMGTPNGNNVSSVSINLNLNQKRFTDPKTNAVIPGFGEYFVDDVAYFRLSVNTTTNFSGTTSQSGSSSVVVKIVANKSIDVFDVDTVKDSSGQIRVKRNETIFCEKNAFQQTICPVLNNQVIGVNLSTSEGEIRDYAWTLNSQALACTSKVSSECSDEKQGAVNFFPISGNVGDRYTLTVVANNAETGKSFTVSRRFQIVDPDFDIVSEATEVAWPRYLGKYRNLDGTESNDMSKTSFDGIPGGVAKFSAIFRPSTLGPFILNGVKAGDDQNEMIWSINGKPFKWNDTGLSLALDGVPGDIYTVSLSGAYNQPLELRKALYDIWRISPFSSETLRFSKEIQIQLVLPEGSISAKGKSNTFFASLLSAVPPVVLFSVRLILSLGLILIIVGVAFSVMPEERRE